MYQNRYYRSWVNSHGLISFQVTCGQTDLMIQAQSDIHKQAAFYATKYHDLISKYIKYNPTFEKSLIPMVIDKQAPPIVISMFEASDKAGVGPMAAVAGAIAEYTGKDLLRYSKEIIIENGGDIFLSTSHKRTIAVYAGNSPLSGKIGIIIPEKTTTKGICTSSGTVGHSLSFGKADAAMAISCSAILADAAATAIGNVVKTVEDIDSGLDIARSISGIDGALIIIGSKLGVWGNIELVRLDQDN
ncbi:MAG: UPF0280 family protein [Dehalococcoidales bacterium]|jgi:ApbE superfamily uncharacterized protein (UPF0280 family)|nr:UPF0280 family protein [Dehalococcoidales bacterium]MDD5605137.1 UPF0280 family protein [Dehalococcoidales bacterium]NLE90121.1 UPF0280 family protein [Dehalococcoidales bacterium]